MPFREMDAGEALVRGAVGVVVSAVYAFALYKLYLNYPFACLATSLVISFCFLFVSLFDPGEYFKTEIHDAGTAVSIILILITSLSGVSVSLIYLLPK